MKHVYGLLLFISLSFNVFHTQAGPREAILSFFGSINRFKQCLFSPKKNYCTLQERSVAKKIAIGIAVAGGTIAVGTGIAIGTKVAKPHIEAKIKDYKVTRRLDKNQKQRETNFSRAESLESEIEELKKNKKTISAQATAILDEFIQNQVNPRLTKLKNEFPEYQFEIISTIPFSNPGYKFIIPYIKVVYKRLANTKSDGALMLKRNLYNDELQNQWNQAYKQPYDRLKVSIDSYNAELKTKTDEKSYLDNNLNTMRKH